MDNTKKIKLEWHPISYKTFEFQGEQINVFPFIEENVKRTLIDKYLEIYFEDGKYNKLRADLTFKLSVVSILTNIEIVSDDDDFIFDADILNSTNLYEEITSRISNYDGLVEEVYNAVEDRKQQLLLENSTGYVLSSLIEKLNAFLDKMPQDLSEEFLEKLKETSKEIVSTVEKSSIGKVLDDANRTPKQRTKRQKSE